MIDTLRSRLYIYVVRLDCSLTQLNEKDLILNKITIS